MYNLWVSESIDIIKSSDSHECRFCHYWYFFKITFCYQTLLRNGCYNIKKISMDSNYVAIVTLKGNVFERNWFCGYPKKRSGEYDR